MKKRTKLGLIAMSLCLVVALGVIGIFAVKTLNMTVGGNITFTADGISFTVGQGKFYKTDKTTEYANITKQSGKMQGFAMNTNTTLADVSDKIASWAGLELALDSQGDAVLKFNIKNDMADKVIYVSFDVTLGTNTNDNMNIIVPTSEEIGPTDNKNIEITFDILDDTINAGLAGFKVDIAISDTEGGGVVIPDDAIIVDKTTGTVTNKTETKYTNAVYGLNTSTKTATVSPANKSISQPLEIPEKVYSEGREYTVTEVPAYAFAGCWTIPEIKLPDSITTIGDYAFQCCEELVSLNMPTSLTTIGAYAFSSCYLLNIQIPSTVRTIGEGAFAYTGITSAVFPEGMTTIISWLFDGCSNLTSVVIPSTVTSIGQGLFSSCPLTSITINRVTPPTLMSNAFNDINKCSIYVPAESVETYKTASVWSTYASRIQAIPA